LLTFDLISDHELNASIKMMICSKNFTLEEFY